MIRGRGKSELTLRQRRLVKGIAEGQSIAAAARAAGYSHGTVRGSIYRLLQQSSALRAAVAAEMNRAGISDGKIFRRLAESLDATETKFFPFRHTRITRAGDQVVEETGQVIDTREVVAHGIRLGAVELAGRFLGLIGREAVEAEPEHRPTVIFDMSGDIPREVREAGDVDEETEVLIRRRS